MNNYHPLRKVHPAFYYKLFSLADCRFVSTDQKKVQGHKRDNEVLLQRQKAAGLTVPYRVIDNPLKLSTDDW